jgi:predicted nucleic acid-binding Zn ribbon protein
MTSGLKADIYPLISECVTCSKILPTKITDCPSCGRQDPTGYEAKREYDFQIILIKYFKIMFGYIVLMILVALFSFLMMF